MFIIIFNNNIIITSEIIINMKPVRSWKETEI